MNKNRIPVVPAPVYAIKQRLVDSSHNFTVESLPDDKTYWKKPEEKKYM